MIVTNKSVTWHRPDRIQRPNDTHDLGRTLGRISTEELSDATVAFLVLCRLILTSEMDERVITKGLTRWDNGMVP